MKGGRFTGVNYTPSTTRPFRFNRGLKYPCYLLNHSRLLVTVRGPVSLIKYIPVDLILSEIVSPTYNVENESQETFSTKETDLLSLDDVNKLKKLVFPSVWVLSGLYTSSFNSWGFRLWVPGVKFGNGI